MIFRAMKQTRTILLSFSIICVILLNMGCNKSSNDTVLDSITTYTPVNNVTTTSAQVYSVINATADVTLAATGVCWSATNQLPTLSDSHTSNTIDTISYASNLTTLSANTKYYVRGYVTNGAGTAYGNVVTFTTPTSTFTRTATVSTFVGSGTQGLVNGGPTTAQFANPQGLCTDAQGNIYVADSFNSVIRKITPAGVTSTYAGTGTSGYVDGPAATAQFYSPKAVAADAAGNIYVADFGNNLIRKISTTGTVSTLAGKGVPGFLDGTGTAAVFRQPSGLAVDASGNVYVADKGNNAIRVINSAGSVTTLAGNAAAGQHDDTGTAAYFNGPISVAINSAGNIYVADANNYSIRQVTPTGVVTTLVGNYLLKTTLFTPTSLCVDKSGNIFIADPTGRIMEISTGNILFPLAGAANTNGFVNGTNTNALFNSPQSVTTDAAGNVYVADFYNNVIRKIVTTTTP
jgi:streptogramin lyase